MCNVWGLIRLVKYKENAVKSHRILNVSSHYKLRTIKIEPPSRLIITVTPPPSTTCDYPHPPYGFPDVHSQIYWRLQLLRVTELIPQVPAPASLKHAAGSVNGTIKIIDTTGPINKACLQLFRAEIRLILIMEKPLFLHCSSFALFSPGASHIL